MTVANFLNQLVKNKGEYPLTSDDQKTIQREGIGKFIFNKLNSTKYRAQATSDDYLQKVKDKIDLAIACNIPVHITLPFGACKNLYLPTAPGIDWAEVFNLAYLREYLAPIAKAYKYGLHLEYVSVAVFVDKVNRIPQKDVDLYDSQFTLLVKYFQKYLPKNFVLTYSRVSDQIPQKEAIRRLSLKVEQLRKTWDSQSNEEKKQKLFRARRNCVYDPGDENADRILLESALGHDAFCSECWTTKAAPWDEKDMITLGHSYTEGWAIHVRSTRGSSVNFWSGMGALLKKRDEYVPTVLSPKQYLSLKDKIKIEASGFILKGVPKLSQTPVVYE